MNFCNKCGNKIESGVKFCGKCGNQIISNQINNMSVNETQSSNVVINNINNSNNCNVKSNNKQYIIGGLIGIFIVLIGFAIVLIFNNEEKYYFTNDDYSEENTFNNDTNNNQNTVNRKTNRTSIIYDRVYDGVKLNNVEDGIKLIQKDSTSQKNKCPKEIVEIENRIIKKYEIDAINMCEMDVEFAKELENVIKLLYEEFPSARNYLTNITLVNGTMSQNYIAAFQPYFPFATSDKTNGFPVIVKTQILLNTNYFLNTKKIEASVKDGSRSGHFPKNATRYSPLAHEFAHYFSFIAMLKSYNFDSFIYMEENNYDGYVKIMEDFSKGNFSLKMIEEAYNNYKRKTNTTMGILQFRESISGYAVAKDQNGDYIYDETIAEAFHDYYLNKDLASEASKEVVQVLKKHLEKEVVK